MSSSPLNVAIALVHGAWAAGSCWKDVLLPLERRALKVIGAPVPLSSLTDDISALSRVLERTTGPIVLVGHAYAEAVIGAIREERVKSLVYGARARRTGDCRAGVLSRGTSSGSTEVDAGQARLYLECQNV